MANVKCDKINRIKKELTEPGEVEHEYVDLDLIRLVYEDGELIGWYRPDGWGVQMPMDGYAAMVREMIE